MELLQAWLNSKNNTKGLPPFISLLQTDLEKSILHRVIEHFDLLRPSYSDGLKILELATEMILMRRHEELFTHSDSVTHWLAHLNRLRYPVTMARDQKLEKKFLALPWPFGSKVKFERRGDRAGVELKLFITSEADLIKTVAALDRVKTEFQNESPT